MIRYIYTSKIAQTLDHQDLQNIVQSAKKYNQQNDITGLLISNFEYFFQVLEGPEQHVAALYEKIKVDPRHLGIHLMSQEGVTHRLFPDWRMGYLTFPLEDPPIIKADWTKLTTEDCDKILGRVVPK
jgi:hypothetical protein